MTTTNRKDPAGSFYNPRDLSKQRRLINERGYRERELANFGRAVRIILGTPGWSNEQYELAHFGRAMLALLDSSTKLDTTLADIADEAIARGLVSEVNSPVFAHARKQS